MMKIKKTDNINTILPIHKKIFSEEFPLENYYNKIKKYDVDIYIYEENKKIIGYSLVVNEKDELNYYAWYGGVIPQMQGKNITSVFFQYLKDLAYKNNYKSISLATHNTKPYMIILAVKLGFDIYKVKQRNDDNGNKIYFKYFISEEKYKKIDINNMECFQIGTELVKLYKNNYTKIYLEYTENIQKIKYLINYCAIFSVKPKIYIKKNDKILEDMQLKQLIDSYKGNIFIK